MSTVGTARNACAGSGAFLYQRHRPEKTLLYQLVSKHYPVFRQQLAEEGRILPGYVKREFEDYLKCGRLEHGLSLPKTQSMNSFLFYISEKLSCAPVLMVKTTDMRNCHDLSLFWRFN